MKQDFDLDRRDAADAVIARGYEIYDRWIREALPSRRIVAHVFRAISEIRRKKNAAANAEGLSTLFALDLRIRDRYSSLLRLLFCYFAYRRETRAKQLLSDALCLPSGYADLRTAIEVVLKRLREALGEPSEEDDTDTRGGKRNGKTTEQTKTTERKSEQTQKEETPDELPEHEEKKETSEKVNEDATEGEADEQKDEATPLEQTEEVALEKDEIDQNLREKIEITEQTDLQEDTMQASEETEASTKSTVTQARTYNDAIDIAIPFEMRSSVPPTEKAALSFMDEIILDGITRGTGDILGRPIQKETNGVRETIPIDITQPSEKGDPRGLERDMDRFAMHLRDRVPGVEPSSTEPLGEAKETTNETKTEQKPETASTEQKPETKTETLSPEAKEKTTETAPNNTGADLAPKDEKRVPLKVDPALDAENALRRSIGEQMPDHELKQFYNMQAESMREQIRIAIEELGINETVDIPGKYDPVETQPPAVVHQK